MYVVCSFFKLFSYFKVKEHYIKIINKIIVLPIREKANINHSFLMSCIGFFCVAIEVYGARAPPLHDFLQNEIMEGKDMLNDFRNKDFRTIKKEDKSIYYLRFGDRWIEVTKEVYSIYKNSYQKMYRDALKDKDVTELTEYVESQYVKDINPLDDLYLHEVKSILHKAIQWLSKEEQMIIYSYFFGELSERQIAEKLGISKSGFHYRKQKILNNLKKILDQYGI